MKNKKVAILGASGLVGQRLFQKLEGHPYFGIEMAIGHSTVGKKIEQIWTIDAEVPEEYRNMRIEELNIEKILKRDVDTVFSALSGDKEFIKSVETELAENGLHVFSNTSVMRMEPAIPLVIPEVNHEELDKIIEQKWHEESGGCIVKKPNCTTIGATLFEKPVNDLYGIKEINAVTMQAKSGAGSNAYPGGVMEGNIWPFIEGEEEKVINETRKILNLNETTKISARCYRVDVRDGHTENIQIKTKEEADIEELKEYLKRFNPLKKYKLPSSPKQLIYMFEENDRPRPIPDVNNGGGMSLSVGSLRKGEVYNIESTILSHNTIRGAAGGSILTAELAYTVIL